MNIGQELNNNFSLEELKTIAFELGIEYEDLPSTKHAFIRELQRSCERRNLTQALSQSVRKRTLKLNIEDPTNPSFNLSEQINHTLPATTTSSRKTITDKWALIAATIIIIGSIIVAVYAILPSKNSTFDYPINVLDRNDGLPIVRANVNLSIGGSPPIIGLTDNNGNVTLQLPVELDNQTVQIMIIADGYESKRITLLLSSITGQTIQLNAVTE